MQGAGPRRLGIFSLIVVCCAALFPLANRLTRHGGETIILLMGPGLACLLWFGWPGVRRIPLGKYAIYLVVLVLVVAAAEHFAATMAQGRVLWPEVAWVVYFFAAWRLAWALWKRTIGRFGERYRRWARRTRKLAGGLGRIKNPQRRIWHAMALSTGPIRFCLVLFVLVPLVAGSLIHRFKIGNAPEKTGAHVLPIEDVTIPTKDGLRLSGWFLPDKRGESTVVICHGAGANKGNFLPYLLLVYGQGYSGLIFDFRGHGDSDGHTSTFGLFESTDVEAAVDWLKEHRPNHARHVFGLGSSMGSMALVRAAADDSRIEAVVLDSCYVSAPLLAEQHAGRIPLVGSMYGKLVLACMSLHAGKSMWKLDASEAVAALSPRPVFLIHSAHDFVIPAANMRLLCGLAREPKKCWLGPGSHSNIITTDFPQYQNRVIDFFREAVRP